MATKDPATLSIALLSLAHPPETAQQIYTDKILHRPLHLKPNPQNQTLRRQARDSKSQSHKKNKKQKPRPLSARQKRALSLYDLPTPSQGLQYETYLPLHELWVRYIQGLLNLSPTKKTCTPSEAAKLCSADFHGAVVEVVRSRCVGRVGVKGVVVKDLMGVFEVVCQGRGSGRGKVGKEGEERRSDRKVVLPKEGTVFRFAVPLVTAVEGGLERDRMGEKEKVLDGGGDSVMANMITANPDPVDTNQNEEPANEKLKPKELIFELHGDQFLYRAADRANRKFKPHFLKNL